MSLKEQSPQEKAGGVGMTGISKFLRLRLGAKTNIVIGLVQVAIGLYFTCSGQGGDFYRRYYSLRLYCLSYCIGTLFPGGRILANLSRLALREKKLGGRSATKKIDVEIIGPSTHI